MTATITLFSNLTNPTGPELDNTLTTVSYLGVLPCSVAGTNALTLSQPSNSTQYPVTAYFDGLEISGIVAVTNTTALTARLGSLPFLNVYNDSATGPVAPVAGALVAGNAFTLRYDSALNNGTGGWHLISSTASGIYLLLSGGTITGNLNVTGTLTASTLSASLASLTKLQVGASAASITRILSGTASITFSVVAANSFQEQPFSLAGVQVNDSLAVGPPSLTAQGVGLTAFVPAAGTVTLRAVNTGTVSLTPGGGLYRVTAMGFT